MDEDEEPAIARPLEEIPQRVSSSLSPASEAGWNPDRETGRGPGQMGDRREPRERPLFPPGG